MKLVAFVAIVAFSGALHAADIAGVALGSRADARTLEKLGIVTVREDISPGTYRGQKRFELVDAKTLVDVAADGSVAKIEADFYTIEVESIHTLALRKWGKPFDSGAAVMPDGNLELIWIWQTRDGAEITLSSYDPKIEAGTLTKGSLIMITKAAADAKRGPQGSAF